jgi:hypothetical protein
MTDNGTYQEPSPNADSWAQVIEKLAGPEPSDEALLEAGGWLCKVLTALVECGYRLSPNDSFGTRDG